MVETHYLNIKTHGNTHILNLTNDIADIVLSSKVTSGIVTVFVPGATGGLSTIEYEPGLLKDFPKLMEKLIPSNTFYHHNDTWHDGNGHSHLRASLVGPSLAIPFVDRRMTLGTWQQIIFIDFDNRPRDRKLVVQILGD